MITNRFVKYLSNVLGGAIICIALSGCENFLGDVNLKQQLAEDIAYAKAKSIAILIQADEGTGTVVPAGNYTAKRGYPFEISFTEAAGYSFNGWKAVPADDAETLPENAVVFDDPNSIKTNVTVNADISNIKIVPGCDDRIAVKEKSPLLGNTVSRNSSIVVVFSKEPDKQSFIFSEDEIPEGAETVKNDDEEIYAYVHEGETKFKNIQITINDISIAQHYLQPQVEGKTLVINANPARLIEFDQAGSSKIISVTLSDKIFDKDNVSMNKTENWKFTINEETNEKARIELTSNSEEGAVYLAGTRDYSMGQKITLSFTENADYQFLNWQYDNNIVTVDDPYSSDTFAFVKAESNATQIKAVCAPRLRVTEVSPLSTESVSKNTPIEITFNKNLPVDDKGLLQLENISITIGGSPVRTSFKTPAVSNNKVTFTADMQNMLDVPAGQTKTVTVTVPADFYYQLEDENKTKVYYGGNGKTFSYRINETTSEKAFITFSASEGSGTIVKSADSSKGYSIGQEVDISFEPADGWKFTGWTVTSGGEAVDESKIHVADKNALSTKLVVYEALQGVNVTAGATLTPVIVNKKPEYKIDGVECDSKIVIQFNKPMNMDSLSLDTTIKIVDASNDDNSYKSYFNTPSWTGNTLEITPKNQIRKALVKNQGDLCNIKIKIDYSNIFDLEGNTLAGSPENNPSWTYRINHGMETVAPAVNMLLFKRGFNFTQESVAENDTYTELSSLAFESFQPETYPLNHVGKKVYFDAQVYDEGSGYKELTINETLIKTAGGEPVTGAQTYSVTVPFTEDDFADEISQTPSNHSYTFQTTMDGIVELDFVFADNAGNPTEKKWYVIKDTNLDSNTLKKDGVKNDLMKDYKGVPDQSGQETAGEQILYRYASRPLNSTDYFSRNSVNNKFTETISFSNKDTYYSSYSEYAAYAAYWGDDENNISNQVDINTNDKPTLSFTIEDVTKDCYLRIIVCDAVGNAYSEVVKIPKQNAVIGLSAYEREGQYIVTGTFDDRIFFYKYKADENSEWSEIRTQEYSKGVYYYVDDRFQFYNGYFSDEKLTPDGIYAFYVIPYNKSSFGFIYGTVSDPFILYHNVTNSSSVSTPEFPDSFECTLDAKEANSSGIRNVHVSLPNTFTPTPGCTYGAYCNLVFRSFLDFDFSVDSGPDRKGKVYLRAYNSAGTMYQSINSVEIDVSYDNIPPVFPKSNVLNEYGGVRLDLSAPNEILLTHKTHGANEIDYLPYDKGVGMYEKEEGIIEFDYYFKKRDNDNYFASSFSRSDLIPLSNSKKTISYPNSATQVKLDFFEPVESGYDIILDLKDKNGNKVLKTFVVSNIVKPDILKVSVTEDDSSYTVSVPEIYYFDNQIRGVFDTCYLENDEWKFLNRTSDRDTKSNSFKEMKIFLRNALNGHYNSFYNFLCPAYELKSAVEKAQYCKSKSVIPGLGGAFQVFYDAPCFAHTMAFPTSMLSALETKTQDALDKDNTVDYEKAYTAVWETRGREYGLKLLYGGEEDNSWAQGNTTYIAPVSEIPAGFSYVTIFHFADGTTVMSDVKQK